VLWPFFCLRNAQVFDVVKRLKEGHLYKSMTSHNDHTLWQDVYRIALGGNRIYLKLQIQNEEAVIVSFKQEDKQ
jgi:motility quorum-sensing regulator / GCU-specific mRNA interferase toxin